jgi:catechol 2,3-dioxygenase-like lactoylglutathione lyase family enzyme
VAPQAGRTPCREVAVASWGVITALDHVQVAAPPGCEAEARAFYGTLLGLVEQPKPPALAARGGVWFGWLHVGVAADFAPARKAHPALRVTGLEALAERLTAAGVEVRWDEEIPGVERFYADDPWGNRLEFMAAP